MSEFKKLRAAVSKQFDRMKQHELFRTKAGKDELWDTYLKAFPAGSNPIYKENTEHDCNCCKGFIRAIGNVVAIIDGKTESIWDVNVEGTCYQPVANSLSELVKSKLIDNIFLHTENEAGKENTYQEVENGPVITWNHFHLVVPSANRVDGEDIGTALNLPRTSKEVMLRALNGLTDDSVNTVLELIAQNSLYRGEENLAAVQSFQKLQKKFKKLQTDAEKDIFCWSQVKTTSGAVSGIRNTSIGTLLVDISEGKELDLAVASFESKVAPTNYKRPTALVTKAQVERARAAIEEMGLTSALDRRFATINDVTINNLLFADRDAKKHLKGGNIFDDLSASVSEKPKNFDKVEEIGIEDFITKILPQSDSIELMVENRHSPNLVSLIAPVDPSAKNMFKWPNNFSWSYTGELADSIKERVKRAGGKVDGDLRFSLSWFNHDDLDLHMVEPGGYRIHFANRYDDSPCKGRLDVDMNAGYGTTRTPVENICYLDRKYMREGVYGLMVNNYMKRESVDVGFEMEIEFDGITTTISHPEAVKDKDTILVAAIEYTKKDGFKIVKSLPSSQAVKEMWNIKSQSFHRVTAALKSPNHWDERAVGNKHYFFMLDGCLNDGKARPFFNEFLSGELTPHRKVFELVGSKMKTEESDNQLSGIGFSSTQRNHVLCRVKGNFTRVVKIVF